jgi:AcrR family transcriptional regulator
MEVPMPRTRTAEKEEEILEAASAVFAARRFHEVLVDEVAGKAGVGKGTIYRYFDTKEELYLAVVQRGFSRLNERLAASLVPGVQPRERLRCEACEILRFFWDRRDFFALMQRAGDRMQHKQGEIRRDRDRLRDGLSAIIAEGVRRREFRPVPPRRAADLFLGLVRAALLSRQHGETAESLADEVVLLFTDGVARRDAA